MGQINTNNYPAVNSLSDADLLIVENATNGTGTTTPKQLRENAIGTDTLQTSAQTVTGAINELKHEIDLGAGVARYDVNTITSGYLGQFSGSANLLLLHLTTDGIADATNGYMMMLSYSRPVARFAYGRLVDSDGVAYKQDVYADNTIICTISGSGEGTESDPVQVVILGIVNAGFMLTPTAVVSDRDIQDGQGNTLSVLAEALTKTASGNPVVISDCAGGKARSLITEINAIQDLHGYDKPWVGGANVQLVDFSNYQSLSNNVSFDYTDGDVTLRSTGTTPNYPLVQYNITSLKGKTLYFADTFTTNDEGLGHIQIIYSVDGQTSYVEVGRNPNPQTGYSIPNNAEWVNLRLHLRNGTSIESGKWVKYGKIMCASSANPTYSPYANICPISGRTAAVITRSDGDEISEDFTIQLGQTVYGADINWDTGVMSITSVKIKGNSPTWTKHSTSINNVYITDTSESVKPSAHDTVTNSICSDYEHKSWDNLFVANAIGFAISNNGRFAIANPNIATLSAFETAIADADICYELATPTTIQLTPTEVQMLKGYNRVSIEDGSIELGYIAKLT